MWLFIIILFFFGFIHTAVNLSLIKERKNILIYLFSLTLALFVLFPLSIRISIEGAIQLINDPEVLSFFCTFQILESLLSMILSLSLIRAYYSQKVRPFSEIAALLPSAVFLSGAFLFQTFIFRKISGLPFTVTALIFSIIAAVSMFICFILFRAFFRSWETRMEIKIVLSFFQIIMATFLPLMLSGISSVKAGSAGDFKTTAVSLTLIILIILSGKYLNKIRRRPI